MKKTNRSSNGFTIVELLMYCAILTSFLYVMLQIFSSALDIQLSSEATSAVAQDGRYLLSRFAYDIGRATDITIPAASGTTADSLQLTIAGSSYTYALQNGNLVLTAGADSVVLNSLGTTVSNVSFHRFGTVNVKNNVQLLFTVTSRTVRNTGPEVRSFQTTLGLR